MIARNKAVITSIIFLVFGLYSCGPKITASFTNSGSNFHAQNQESIEKDGKLSLKSNNTDEEIADPKVIIIEEAKQATTRETVTGLATTSELSDAEFSEMDISNNKEIKSRLEVLNTEQLYEGYSELDRKDKKALKKNFRNYLKDRANNINEESEAASDDMLLIILLTVLLPPLGVYLVYDVSTEFWISLLLTLLGFLPGLIYSLIVVLR